MLILNKLVLTESPVKIAEIESHPGMSFVCHLNIRAAPIYGDSSTHRNNESSVS